jgi:hypothetical protein
VSNLLSTVVSCFLPVFNLCRIVPDFTSLDGCFSPQISRLKNTKIDFQNTRSQSPVTLALRQRVRPRFVVADVNQL